MSDVPVGQQCSLSSYERYTIDTAQNEKDRPKGKLHQGSVSSNEDAVDCNHQNPVDVGDATDEERAQMLLEYLDAFRAEFGRTPKLMPLDGEGKAPWITGRCSLDSAEADAALVDGYEAARRIHHDGARGFAIYAGRSGHGTAGVAFVDHDDTDAFPSPTADPTLEVLSGSGRGTHETYRNEPGDRVRNARLPDEAGEIRAENWYVVVPGSVHPSGGVYHVVENREIATLSNSELTDDMRSNAKRREQRDSREPGAPKLRDLDGDAEHLDNETIGDRLEAAFEHSPTGEKYRAIYDGRYASAGYDDRSTAEFALANWVDMWVGFGDSTVVEDILEAGNLQKWPERPDAAYRDSILANVGYQDWYADDEEDSDTEDVDYVAVLPHSPRARAAANGWDWQSADRADTSLTIDTARDRTTEAIGTAYETADRVLVEALPTMGKSYGAIKAAAETGALITLLTGRGNKEQYEQLREWCEEHDLRAKVLSSVWRDCETFQGEHGEAVAETVKDWYRRGATGKDIHKDAEYELGRPLPCDGPAGARCSYKIGWEFDPDEYDVLIGNYLHAHVASATKGRTIVFDEFPGDAFETTLDVGLPGSVTHFLQQPNGLPFDDHADLMANRSDPSQRADALAWFQDHAPERDGTLAFAPGEGHAAAPLATFTLIAGAASDLGNGWERASLPGFDGGVGLYDRENGRVHLHTPPDLRYTRGVVALDGTPTPALWEIALGTRLNHRPVLTDVERGEYLRDTLGLNIVRTTDAVKPYSRSEEHVAVRQDHALLEAIREEHGQKPSLLTTQTAEDVYRDEGVLEAVRDVDHYGNLKGSNERASTRLGVVIGSRNFGDGFVEKWGAFAGEAVAEPDRSRAENRGVNLSYGGEIGDDVLRHMREHETLQAVMRFGRDGLGATIYVHTNTLPEWVEDVLAGQGRVIQTWSDGMRQVLEAARELDEWTTAEIVNHPVVEIGEWQVRDHLHKLAKRGYVDVETEGNGFVWRDDGLHRVSDYGDVELTPLDLGELSEAETSVVSRSVTYTWDHAGSSDIRDGSAVESSGTNRSTFASVLERGDRPPDNVV